RHRALQQRSVRKRTAGSTNAVRRPRDRSEAAQPRLRCARGKLRGRGLPRHEPVRAAATARAGARGWRSRTDRDPDRSEPGNVAVAVDPHEPETVSAHLTYAALAGDASLRIRSIEREERQT